MAPTTAAGGIKVVKDLDEYKAITENPTDKKLFVVDLYATWCGPCVQLLPTWKSLQQNIDMFEDRCLLLQVDISVVKGFEDYPQTSKPHFLFLKDGQLLKEVEYLDSPQILRCIDENIPPPAAEE